MAGKERRKKEDSATGTSRSSSSSGGHPRQAERPHRGAVHREHPGDGSSAWQRTRSRRKFDRANTRLYQASFKASHIRGDEVFQPGDWMMFPRQNINYWFRRGGVGALRCLPLGGLCSRSARCRPSSSHSRSFTQTGHHRWQHGETAASSLRGTSAGAGHSRCYSEGWQYPDDRAQGARPWSRWRGKVEVRDSVSFRYKHGTRGS